MADQKKADPITISFISGLKSLNELDRLFERKFYESSSPWKWGFGVWIKLICIVFYDCVPCIQQP